MVPYLKRFFFRGSSSRASSVQRSRSTSPFNSKINSHPPRSPEIPEAVSLSFLFDIQWLAKKMDFLSNYFINRVSLNLEP